MRYRNNGNASLLRILPAGAIRVLDVGCGAGDNARLLASRGCRVTAVTLSDEEARVASPWCERVWVADVERRELPAEGAPYDVLLMSHVLEHLVAPSQTLIRLAPLLRPGGWLLIAVPNMAHWRVRWRILRGDWHGEDTGFFDRTHLHFWSCETVAEILRNTPFDLIKAQGTDGSIPLPLRSRVPRLASVADRIATSAVPNLTAYQVVVLAQRST